MDGSPSTNSCPDCPGRLVCRCLRVTEAVLVSALTTGEIRSVQDIRRCTGAGDGCTACHRLLRRYLDGNAHSSLSPICSVR